MTRIVLLEDHGLIAHTVAAALGGRDVEVVVVDPAIDGDLTVPLLAAEPELALLDLDLGPRGTSLELVGPLTEAEVPVVVVTGVTDPVRRAECVAAGAVGVLDKSGSFDTLVASIERVLASGTLLSSHERDEHLALLRGHTAAERERLAPFERLTRREAEVLGALMRGRSVEQIATAEVVSVTTVRTHVRGILTKLEVGTQLAATARATDAGWRPPS
jgi:two-component system, NarL family, nitrate/nitrite response regulator NarL